LTYQILERFRKHQCLYFVILVYWIFSGCSTEEPLKPTHQISSSNNNRFDRNTSPALRVNSGAIIQAHIKEASNGYFVKESNGADVLFLDKHKLFPLAGPIYIEEAKTGDILAVKFRKIKTVASGWTLISPGLGLLKDEFSKPYFKSFLFDKNRSVAFSSTCTLPLKAFPAIIGVAPEEGSWDSTPGPHGGNLGNSDLAEGSTIYLPVFVDGALLSLGNGQAVQGEGSVTGIGIAVSMDVLFEVNVLKNQTSIKIPHYQNENLYGVIAADKTIDSASKTAVRRMIDYLANYGLTWNEAYALTSIACDLKALQIVNQNVTVAMTIPKSIFEF